MGIELGFNHDLGRRLEDLESKVQGLATQDILQNASIGAGGLTVEGSGGITVTGGGSLTITGSGSLNVASGGLNSAGSISAGTTITAGGDITSSGDLYGVNVHATAGSVTATGGISAGGNLSVGGTTTATGDIFTPNATAAVSGYTICYINVDGRVSKGASSARYKISIAPVDPAALGPIFPQLHRFVMRGDPDETVRLGHIAEHLAADPVLRRFVVYAPDENGDIVPESIDFIGLLLAQTSQLDQRLTSANL